MQYTKLALALIDGTRPEADGATRTAAATAQRQLASFVTDAARRVHRRYNYLRPQRADDFVADAPGHVSVVLLQKYAAFHAGMADLNRSDDPAAGFISTTLANQYVSIARRRSAVQLVNEATGPTGDPLDRRPTAAADDRATVDATDFWSAPLPAEDRQAVGSWRPIDRCVLLLLSGLHTKVDPADWSAWTRSAGATGPVPSPDTDAMPEGKRRDGLAADLGISRNGLDQIWSRKRDRLAGLRFVKQVGLSRHVGPGRTMASDPAPPRWLTHMIDRAGPSRPGRATLRRRPIHLRRVEDHGRPSTAARPGRHGPALCVTSGSASRARRGWPAGRWRSL